MTLGSSRGVGDSRKCARQVTLLAGDRRGGQKDYRRGARGGGPVMWQPGPEIKAA